MATYSGTVTTRRPAAEVFAYMADFSNVSDWDPQIEASRHTGSGSPAAKGATFHVTQGSFELDYETTEYDEGAGRVVLFSDHEKLTSTDTITVVADAEGTHVTYAADIRWKGFRKGFEPAFVVLLRTVIGPRARKGLAKQLGGS